MATSVMYPGPRNANNYNRTMLSIGSQTRFDHAGPPLDMQAAIGPGRIISSILYTSLVRDKLDMRDLINPIDLRLQFGFQHKKAEKLFAPPPLTRSR